MMVVQDFKILLNTIIMKKQHEFSRRDFFKSSALGAFGALTVPAILTGCTGTESKNGPFVVNANEILFKAPAGRPLKAGLVGCGGRGTGAAADFLAAGDYGHLVPLAGLDGHLAAGGGNVEDGAN